MESHWPSRSYQFGDGEVRVHWLSEWSITDPCPKCGSMATIQRDEGHTCFGQRITHVLVCAGCGLGFVGVDKEYYSTSDVWVSDRDSNG